MELSVIFYHENEALKKRSSVIRIFFRLRRAQNNTISFIQSYQNLWQFYNRQLSMSCNSGAMDGSDTVRESVTWFWPVQRCQRPISARLNAWISNREGFADPQTLEKRQQSNRNKRFQAIQLSCRSELDMSCILGSHGAYWHTCSVQYSNSSKTAARRRRKKIGVFLAKSGENPSLRSNPPGGGGVNLEISGNKNGFH